jgi:hypothetical protein
MTKGVDAASLIWSSDYIGVKNPPNVVAVPYLIK